MCLRAVFFFGIYSFICVRLSIAQHNEDVNDVFNHSFYPQIQLLQIIPENTEKEIELEEDVIRTLIPAIRNEQKILKLNYSHPDSIKKFITDGRINFYYKFSKFPKWQLDIPIPWTKFDLEKFPYQEDGSWQFFFLSLDWIDNWYSGKKSDLDIKYRVAGYIISDYARNVLGRGVKFEWRDHGIARRLERVTEFLRRYISSTDSLDIDVLRNSLAIVSSHYLAAAMDTYYPVLPHNHGFQIDLALLDAINFFNFRFEDYAFNRALERMQWQLQNSITVKGVHLEHSPGYQIQYINLINKVIEKLIERKLSVPDFLINNQDKLFQTSIYFIQGNGTLVQFGDTQNNYVLNGLNRYLEKYKSFGISDTDFSSVTYFITKGEKGNPPKERVKIFENAGYATFINEWQPKFRNNVIGHFSCNFHSWTHYHRAEGTFSIYGYGSEIVVDAGHFNFNKKNKYTSYQYQAFAHNVMLVNGNNFRPSIKYKDQSKIVDYRIDSQFSYVVGSHRHNKPYGINGYKRIFGMNNDNFFYVSDRFSTDSIYFYQQVIHLHPDFDQIETLDANTIFISSSLEGKPGLVVFFDSQPWALDTVKGDENETNTQGWYFQQRNTKEASNTLLIKRENLNGIDNKFQISFILNVVPPSKTERILKHIKENKERYMSLLKKGDAIN